MKADQCQCRYQKLTIKRILSIWRDFFFDIYIRRMKNLKKFIYTSLMKSLNEAYLDKDGNLQDFAPIKLVDFDSFPEDVRKTLEDEYGHFQYNFDWNKKQDELGSDFRMWFEENKSEEFLKNLDDIIRKVTQDMILIKKKKMAEKKLEAFEDLIKDSLSHEVLSPALSKFEEMVLMNPYLTLQELSDAFREAKNIIDQDGNIDFTKVEKSDFFTGGDINLPRFERFVAKNPDYLGVFDTWKKLFDESMNLSIKELNAFRSSTPIKRIRELRNFLIDFKKHKNGI